jgi:hypothetical protein
MKKFIALGSLVIILTLATSTVSAQTVPNIGSQNQYPSGFVPPINNINNGIQGSVGYGGSSQCGTSVSAGVNSNPINVGSVIDNSTNRSGNSLGAQIALTHNFSNPCVSQKEQICTTGKIGVIQSNPTMDEGKLRVLLSLFDSFCGK